MIKIDNDSLLVRGYRCTCKSPSDIRAGQNAPLMYFSVKTIKIGKN